MCLSIVSTELLEEEKQIQNVLYHHIDNFSHIKFNAGAGAGKTYALIESLKHIINVHGAKLKYHNQNILCITYTNVATDEIRGRLGNSRLVKVSTIHEQLWGLIKDYQKQLIEIHKENIQRQLINLNYEVYEDESTTDYREFRSLDHKDEFIELMISKKNIFYRNIDKSVAEVRNVFQDLIEQFPNILTSKARFSKTVKKLYKIRNYTESLAKIEANRNGYTRVNYDSKFNNDILHKMIISHDTLLDYALTLVERFDILKQIIINKYPYILIDEYQDTDQRVVTLIKVLADYANMQEYNSFIGYFGDTAQNIYDTGIGNRIDELHPNLESIDKNFNRRSAVKIINVINNIRNDNIQQVSIYQDSDCGSIDFYQGDRESINTFIESCKQEWNINRSNKLHCLVLKNELVAKYNGFQDIYDKFRVTNYYKKNWESINSELLSNDLSKLGNVQILIYKILDLKFNLENSKTSIPTIIKEDIYKPLQFNFKEIFYLVEQLKSITGASLEEYIQALFAIYQDTDRKGFKEVVEDLFSRLNDYSYDGFIDYLLDQLYDNIDTDEELEGAKQNLSQLLSRSFVEYQAWFDFINKKEKNSDVMYHTYHGTKGEEYENVVIIMENSFRGNDNKFSTFFTDFNNAADLQGATLESFLNTRNLLYVACSRSRKNLRIFYLDDVSNFRNNIENIFGQVSNF